MHKRWCACGRFAALLCQTTGCICSSCYRVVPSTAILSQRPQGIDCRRSALLPADPLATHIISHRVYRYRPQRGRLQQGADRDSMTIGLRRSARPAPRGLSRLDSADRPVPLQPEDKGGRRCLREGRVPCVHSMPEHILPTEPGPRRPGIVFGAAEIQLSRRIMPTCASGQAGPTSQTPRPTERAGRCVYQRAKAPARTRKAYATGRPASRAGANSGLAS